MILKNEIATPFGLAMTDGMRLLHGVYPEQYLEILRFAQNDRGRRARNDKWYEIASRSLP